MKEAVKDKIAKTTKAAGDFGRGFRSEFRKQLLTLVTAAFGFTAALFWNTAIKNTIGHFIPQTEAWYWEIGTAVFVTLIAVLAIYTISRMVRQE